MRMGDCINILDLCPVAGLEIIGAGSQCSFENSCVRHLMNM